MLGTPGFTCSEHWAPLNYYFSFEHSLDVCMHACYNTTMICFTFYQQVGRLQQKVDEMEMTQRDLVAEYEEHVLHLKEEVYQG